MWDDILFPDFMSLNVWLSITTLTFLEIVLGVDNIIFISIIGTKLRREDRGSAVKIGLLLAMLMRLIFLFGISILIAMNQTLFQIEFELFQASFTGQSLIMLLGGLFLLYKSVKEMHEKLEGNASSIAPTHKTTSSRLTLYRAIIEIGVINLLFSLDSILTAVGMTNGVEGALIIMVIAVVFSVVIMMLFAIPVGDFVNRHPSIQMLGLSFLILVGFMLILEGAHMASLEILGTVPGVIPKGYLYFAIAFSLAVEMLNMRLRAKPVQLHGTLEDGAEAGLYSEADEKDAVD